VLLDTGPLVAVLDRDDPWHDACVERMAACLARCLTSEAVVCEACHLVGRGGGRGELPLEALLAAGIPILGLEPPGHRQAAALMARYRNLPMDYADASLVVLADALDIPTVFTLDRRGFGAYRRLKGSALVLVPLPRRPK
jgi:hypothetical protein